MATPETQMAANNPRPTPVTTPPESPNTPLATPDTLPEQPATKLATPDTPLEQAATILATPDTPLEQAKMRLDKESARAEPNPASLKTNVN